MVKAVFTENGDGTYDLVIDGRHCEYDLEPDEFVQALRRRRFDGTDVFIEDLTGYRTRWVER